MLRALVTVLKSSKRTLMPIVRPRRSSLRERVAQLAGQAVQHRLELLQAAQVAVEGRLARLGLGHPHGLDGAIVLEARERGEVGAEPRAEPLRELLVRRGAEPPERRDAELLEPARRSSGRCPG